MLLSGLCRALMKMTGAISRSSDLQTNASANLLNTPHLTSRPTITPSPSTPQCLLRSVRQRHRIITAISSHDYITSCEMASQKPSTCVASCPYAWTAPSENIMLTSSMELYPNALKISQQGKSRVPFCHHHASVCSSLSLCGM